LVWEPTFFLLITIEGWKCNPNHYHPHESDVKVMNVNYSYFQESYYHLFYYYSYSNQVVFHVEMNEIKKNCPLRIVLPFQHNIIWVNEALNEGVKQKGLNKGVRKQSPFRHSNIPS
jgi:hypothetical protein